MKTILFLLPFLVSFQARAVFLTTSEISCEPIGSAKDYQLSVSYITKIVDCKTNCTTMEVHNGNEIITDAKVSLMSESAEMSYEGGCEYDVATIKHLEIEIKGRKSTGLFLCAQSGNICLEADSN